MITNLACLIHPAAHDGILHHHLVIFALPLPAADKVLPLPSDVPAKPQAVMGGRCQQRIHPKFKSNH